MRHIALFLIIIISLNYSFGQEKIKTKKIIKNFTTYYKSYKVLKEDRTIKHGTFKKARHVSRDILEIGVFVNGNKTGIWEYYNDMTGDLILEQKYDFSKNSMIFNKNEELNQFEIFKDNKWVNTKIEVPPIHIGGQMNLYLEILEKVEIPESAKKDKIEGPVIAILTLNENGETENIEIYMSLRDDCDKAIIEAIKKNDSDWIIPTINGGKYRIKYPIAFVYAYHEWTTSQNISHSIYFIDTPKNKRKWAGNQ